MISARLGHFLDKPLAPIAKRIPVNPNLISITGFLVTVAAAASIPESLTTGGVLILAGGAFDVLDGIVARANGRTTAFGAFLDSTLDRYSDSFIFLAIAWHFFARGNLGGTALTLGSLIGALLVSYVRARAEGLDLECKVGLMERPERVVLIAAGCIAGGLYYIVMALFVLSHITVVQRILHVYRAFKTRTWE